MRCGGENNWLVEMFDKMISSQDGRLRDADALVEGKTIAAMEEHILRCLGAAVILQWNTIPTKLQRELLDTAGSLGDVPETVALRGQIARFLHRHKDEVNPASCVSKLAMTDERNA